MNSAQAILDEVCRDFPPIPLVKPLYDTSVVFRIGYEPPKRRETAREKHNRIRNERVKRFEEARKKKRKAFWKTQGPAEPYKPWRILPDQSCISKEVAFYVDLLSGNTYAKKKESLLRLGTEPRCAQRLLPALPFMKEMKKKLILLKKQAAEVIEKNQQVRWTLRCFLHKWRSTHLKLHNQEDPITMSVPETPLFIRSWKQRRIYQFDATSLGRTFHLRLLHHDGPFPHPLRPMNPFTNELLTLSQCLSVFSQLKRSHVGHWTLDAFQGSGFQINRYVKAHDKALRLHALKSILWDYKDYDGIDTVFDFIEAQHDHHGSYFQKQLYSWFLNYMPDETTMLQWRRLCMKWHETEILEGDGVVKEAALDRIQQSTEKLCDVPTQLLVKRRLFLAQTK